MDDITTCQYFPAPVSKVDKGIAMCYDVYVNEDRQDCLKYNLKDKEV